MDVISSKIELLVSNALMSTVDISQGQWKISRPVSYTNGDRYRPHGFRPPQPLSDQASANNRPQLPRHMPGIRWLSLAGALCRHRIRGRGELLEALYT